MKTNKQTAVDVDPRKLRPHPDNPRRSDVPRLTELVKQNGVTRRVIIWAKDKKTILAGWHRSQAALKANESTVPALYVECDAKTARRIVLADNRASDRGGYDDQQLAELLAEISDAGLLDASGFSTEELTKIVDQSTGAKDQSAELQPVYQVAVDFGDETEANAWRLKMEDAGRHVDLKAM